MQGWGGQCKIDADACPCKDVGWSGKTTAAWATDGRFFYEELGVTGPVLWFVFIVHQVLGGLRGPGRGP